MRRTLAILLAIVNMVGSTASAAPTLLGDTISFLRAYPTSSTPFGPSIPDTTVVAGPSDQVTWASTAPATFDPEANSITLTFATVTRYLGIGSVFDGFVVSGVDAEIAAVSLVANTSGLAVSLMRDLHAVFINLSGFTAAGGSLTFAVDLRERATVVPEPATLALLISGMIGTVGLSRARKDRRAPAKR